MAAHDPPFDPQQLHSSHREGKPSHRSLGSQDSNPHPQDTMAAGNGRYVSAQKPINDAVTDAFGQSQPSYSVPPELISQITQNVIKQLQTAGLEGTSPSPQVPASTAPTGQQTHTPSVTTHHPSTTPAQNSSHLPAPLSPTISNASSNMPNRVLTPPSPHKENDAIRQTSTPPPQVPSLATADPFSERSHSPSTKVLKSHTVAGERPASSMSHGSDHSDASQPRPKGPSRLDSSKEETTLEKIWGPLFDTEARPMPRLGQLLRGLAIHIIEDYEPKHSIVVTPDKMIKFYEHVKLDKEVYPWPVIFDDERSSISRMYREQSCQHHLVQERFHERPDIPGLTPVGFERWTTLMLQAHPDMEFERLQKAVLSMPISNPDDKKERFPKEISRRLFPSHPDLKVRHDLEDSMVEHAGIELPRSPNHEEMSPRKMSPVHRQSNTGSPESKDQRPSVSFAEPEATTGAPAPPPTSKLERERAPYSTVPESAIVDDTNPEPPQPKPIERERKPWIGKEGKGKNYEAEDIRPRERDGSFRAANSNNARPARSNSTTARPRPMSFVAPGSIPQQFPASVPKPEIHQPYRVAANSVGGHPRRRSPSFTRGTTHPGNDLRRSDGDLRNTNPAGGIHSDIPFGSAPRASEPVFVDASDSKRYFEHQARERVAREARRKADDDMGLYGCSPRKSGDATRRTGDYVPVVEDEHWRDRRDRGRRDTRGAANAYVDEALYSSSVGSHR